MRGVRGNRTYLDMALRLLVVDEGADAFHKISRVLVGILYDANAAGRVVELDIHAKGVQVALD